MFVRTSRVVERLQTSHSGTIPRRDGVRDLFCAQSLAHEDARAAVVEDLPRFFDHLNRCTPQTLFANENQCSDDLPKPQCPTPE
jgi:hypothetical protein